MNAKIPKEVYNLLTPLYQAYVEYGKDVQNERRKLRDLRENLEHFKNAWNNEEWRCGTNSYISLKRTSDYFVIDNQKYSLREYEELIRQTKKNIRIAQHNRDKALQLYQETAEPFCKKYGVICLISCDPDLYLETVDRIKLKEAEIKRKEEELAECRKTLEALQGNLDRWLTH